MERDEMAELQDFYHFLRKADSAISDVYILAMGDNGIKREYALILFELASRTSDLLRAVMKEMEEMDEQRQEPARTGEEVAG